MVTSKDFVHRRKKSSFHNLVENFKLRANVVEKNGTYINVKFARLSQRMIESAKNSHLRISLAFFKVLSRPIHSMKIDYHSYSK